MERLQGGVGVGAGDQEWSLDTLLLVFDVPQTSQGMDKSGVRVGNENGKDIIGMSIN